MQIVDPCVITFRNEVNSRILLVGHQRLGRVGLIEVQEGSPMHTY